MMFQTERLAFNAEEASLDDDLERSYGSGGPIHESTTGIFHRLSGPRPAGLGRLQQGNEGGRMGLRRDFCVPYVGLAGDGKRASTARLTRRAKQAAGFAGCLSG